jgi:NAD(P)H-hydrate epimerase
MSTLLTGSEDVIHGVIGAMRFIATAGATRPFVGPEAEMVNAMALTFESGRAGLAIGGPVLARGGSGDVLAGLIGGLLAQVPDEPLLAAVRGVVWHGQAADALARANGQTAVVTTQLLDYLGVALRESVGHVAARPASHEAGYPL